MFYMVSSTYMGKDWCHIKWNSNNPTPSIIYSIFLTYILILFSFKVVWCMYNIDNGEDYLYFLLSKCIMYNISIYFQINVFFFISYFHSYFIFFVNIIISISWPLRNLNYIILINIKLPLFITEIQCKISYYT